MLGTLSIQSGPVHVVPAHPEPDIESELFIVGADAPPGPVRARAFMAGPTPPGATTLVVTDGGLLVRSAPDAAVHVERGRKRRFIPVDDLRMTPLRADDLVVVTRQGERAVLVYEPDARLTLGQGLAVGLAASHMPFSVFAMACAFLLYAATNLYGGIYIGDTANGRTPAMLSVIRTSLSNGEYRKLDKGISSTLKTAIRNKFTVEGEAK